MHSKLSHMSSKDEKATLDSLGVPRLRYVHAAIGVQHRGSPDGKAKPVTYVIEEEICKEEHGRFCKYINNGAAVVLPGLSPKEKSIGEFLAFCQHVQWERTGNLIFTSDFQARFHC